MSLSVFEYKEAPPDGAALAEALGASASLWDDVLKKITDGYENVSSEWKYYSRSSGWILIVKSGKRTLVYLIPMGGYFKANFVFGDRAKEEALASDIPEKIKTSISSARPYVEGRSFMADVKKSDDAAAIMELVGIKNRN